MKSRSNPLQIDPSIDLHIVAWERDLTIAATESIIESLVEFAKDSPGFWMAERGDRRFDLKFPPVYDPVEVAKSIKDYADRNEWLCVVETRPEAEKKSAHLKQLTTQLEQNHD